MYDLKYYKAFLCFIISVGAAYAAHDYYDSYYAAIGVFMGLFMAMNIGANDVANNLSASIGANAMTLKVGIIIAIIFEFSGAMIAGGDVTSTIKKGIIDPGMIGSQVDYIWIMIAALSGAAIWLTIATRLGYPVSTTHSIVGGVMGSGIMYGIVGEGSLSNGLSMVDWIAMAQIAASWIISPVLGGVVAYMMFSVIESKILRTENKIDSAKVYVPLLISAMSLIFSTYLILKGLKKIWPEITGFGNSMFSFISVEAKPSLLSALVIAFIISLIVFSIVKPLVNGKANKIDRNLSDDVIEDKINRLFIIPIILSAAALCFAHGANDVANAIGPLAGIIDAVQSGEVSSKANIPLWVMLVGAGGLVIGLALFGSKMVKKVGSEVVNITIVAAFSVNFSAALTVVIASQLGLPVSSTHIAIGAIVGVGFYKEMKSRLNLRIKKLGKQVKESKYKTTDLQSQQESLIKRRKKLEQEYDALDEKYEAYKRAMTAKKEQNPGYHKDSDEEAELKRFNRTLKNYGEEIASILEDILDIERQLGRESENYKQMKLELAGVDKETHIERGFAQRIAITWIITVPSALAISGCAYMLLRGFFVHGCVKFLPFTGLS